MQATTRPIAKPVEPMGGEILLESQVGEGSTFIIMLPMEPR
jgi:signal transduction histidine kinase